MSWLFGNKGSPKNSDSGKDLKEINISEQPFLTVSLKLSREAKPTIILNNKGEYLPKDG